MSQVNWPDVISAAGVVVALGLGIASLKVAHASKDEARRSAKAAEDSARAGEQAAEAAQASARQAAEAVRIEREREHARLGPGPVPEIEAKLEVNPRYGPGGPRALFGEVTVPRDYRVRAEAVMAGGGYTSMSLPLLLHAGHPYRFAIEQWAPDRKKPQAEHVLFRFWPPAEGDDVNPWACPCGRPAADGAVSEHGHWEWLAPIRFVSPPPRPQIF